jgi:beta-lactamase class A
MEIANSEKEIGSDWQIQYKNSTTPAAAVEVLRFLFVRGIPSDKNAKAEDDSAELLLRFMADSTPGVHRLKGLLPKATVVAHKTGTSGTQNSITAATNDIGIIYLPNGKHLAIAVFVSDSHADEKTREAVIAKIAKAGWDRWSK